MPKPTASDAVIVNRIAIIISLVCISLAAAFVLWPRPQLSDGESHPEIEKFLDTYFSTWSANDMRGYEDCFHPRAVITYVQNREALALDLKEFIRLQAEGHKRAAAPMREIPLSKHIQTSRDIAQAQVRWRLTKADGVSVGTDYFTLVRGPKNWRIVSLTYCEDPE